MSNTKQLVIMVGTFRTGKKIDGYLFCMNKGQRAVQVVNSNTDLINFFTANNVINAEIKKSDKGLIELKGTNGIVDRYPIINTKNGEIVYNSLIVYSRLNDGFRFLNAEGKEILLTNKEALAFSRMYGIANGKVTNISGTDTISSISGTYPYEDISVMDIRRSNVRTAKANTVTTVGDYKPVEVPDETKDVMGSSFYAELEKAFGKERTAVLKYLFEVKKVDVEKVTVVLGKLKSIMKKEGIALTGLIQLSNDNEDAELERLLKVGKLVQAEALDIVKFMNNKGIIIDKYWDAPAYLGLDEMPSVYDITLEKIENCVGNFLVDNPTPDAKIDITPMGVLIPYFGKQAVSKSNCSLAGFNPVLVAFTFLDKTTHKKFIAKKSV